MSGKGGQIMLSIAKALHPMLLYIVVGVIRLALR